MLLSLSSHYQCFLLSYDIYCSLNIVFLRQSQLYLPIEIEQQRYVSHSVHRVYTVLNVLQVLDKWNYLLLRTRSQMLQPRFKLFKMITCFFSLQKSGVYFIKNLLSSDE